MELIVVLYFWLMVVSAPIALAHLIARRYWKKVSERELQKNNLYRRAEHAAAQRLQNISLCGVCSTAFSPQEETEQHITYSGKKVHAHCCDPKTCRAVMDELRPSGTFPARWVAA